MEAGIFLDTKIGTPPIGSLTTFIPSSTISYTQSPARVHLFTQQSGTNELDDPRFKVIRIGGFLRMINVAEARKQIAA
jgi:hypothetical protein